MTIFCVFHKRPCQRKCPGMASCADQREAETAVRITPKAKSAALAEAVASSQLIEEPRMRKRRKIGRITWWKPTPYCSAAERLVLAHRFALYLDRWFAGVQSLFDLIEAAGEEGPTTAELTAFLELIEADRGSIAEPAVDQPSVPDMEAIFPRAEEDPEACIEPQTHPHTPAQALNLLRKFEARRAVVVDAKRHWVYLWPVQANGEVFPVPIVRISRPLLQKVLSGQLFDSALAQSA
jgi:hypothetical protein